MSDRAEKKKSLTAAEILAEAGAGAGVPEDLRAAVQRERAELLAHKHAENTADIAAIELDLSKVRSTKKAIEKHGGVPLGFFARSIQEKESELARRRAITDAELLG